MRKIQFILAALCLGTLSAIGQTKTPPKTGQIPARNAPTTLNDTVVLDKSFEDAGTNAPEEVETRLAPKLYKPGVLVPEQPIALLEAKKEAIDLTRQNPTPLHKECLNIIYTVDPIYSNGTITGALKGTITIKWDPSRKRWIFDYLKYQLVNLDQPACVFMYETD